MATLSTQAQHFIACDMCDDPTQQFCNSCQVSLCVQCVSKHVEQFKSQTHDIVPFTKRKIKLVFPDCEIHTNEKCEAYCKKCDVPVCLKCMVSFHNGHKYKDMSSIFDRKKKVIEKETQEIEIIIPQYKTKIQETKNKLTIAAKEFDEMDKEKEKHRKYWHQEVDTIFNNVGSLLKARKEGHMDSLKSHQSRIKNRVQGMTQTVEQNKEISKSNNVLATTNYKSKLGEYKDMPADIALQTPKLKTNITQGRELSLEIEEYKASLQQLSLYGLTGGISKLSFRKSLHKAIVIAAIPTGVNSLLHVACVGVDEAWVSGEDKTIRRVDLYGSVRDTVTTNTYETEPNDITVTNQGELLYSDGCNRTVNIVKYGRIEILINIQHGWLPDKLCCTKSGDILVSMCTTDFSQRKIVRHQGQIVKQEIDKDEFGKPIYKDGEYGLYVVENTNGDICASDSNADTVIVVDKSGKVRFQYDGTPARRKRSFDPRHVVTDCMSQIIVADISNNCLHILDQNGQFLRCVDNCGLDEPCGLSTDSEGRFWVGMRNSEVKVIQCMK